MSWIVANGGRGRTRFSGGENNRRGSQPTIFGGEGLRARAEEFARCVSVSNRGRGLSLFLSLDLFNVLVALKTPEQLRTAARNQKLCVADSALEDYKLILVSCRNVKL